MSSASKLILLLFIALGASHPQSSLESQMLKGKTLFSREEYFDSITELKRLLFFDRDNKYGYSASELIGQCYKMGAKYSDALYWFTMAEMNASTPDEIYNCRISTVKINILRRTTLRALSLLETLEKDPRFLSKKDDITYWRGWTYIFSDEWDKASLQFAKISPGHKLAKLCDSIDNKQYSVLKAKLLSYFIPGAGQIYTGNYASGLLSLGWNLLWGYTTVTAFNANRIFDGFMVGNLLWLRFYNGSNQNAEKFAVEKNLVISNGALFYLQNVYTGEKP
jgi:hypothetical protein